MKVEEITMRLPGAIKGLQDMIDYINSVSPTKDLKLLEIGCFVGDSTVLFCEAFKEVTAIDPWCSNIGDITDSVDMDTVYEKFLDNTKKYNNIKVIRDFSFKAIDKFSRKKFDVIYIDGSHEYEDTIRDIKDFTPRVKKGGFICGHDYRGKFPGVIKAVKEYFGKEPDKKFKDSSWLIHIK